MKTRSGFVSNSSSSSFCIIGITEKEWIKKLRVLELETAESNSNTEDYYFDYGFKQGKHFHLYGEDYDNIGYIGLDAEILLETRTIPEAKKYMQEKIQRLYSLDVPLECIGFYYGESGGG